MDTREQVRKISEAVIVQDGKLLMVHQMTKRGTIIWNFPGGGIDQGETPEEACIREVKEETGYDVKIVSLLNQTEKKNTFVCEIVGGTLSPDLDHPDNEDILEVDWISLDDHEKFDGKITDTLNLYYEFRILAGSLSISMMR